MAKTFIFKDFLRHVSPASLSEYCKVRGIPYESQLREKDEESLGRFIKIFDKLPKERQDEIELEFQEVNELTPNAGIAMLVGETKRQNQTLPESVLDHMGEYDKAIWFYLN